MTAGSVVPPGIDPDTWHRMSWHQRMVWLRNAKRRLRPRRPVEVELRVKPGPLVCTTCGAIVGKHWAGFTDGEDDFCARSCGPVVWVEPPDAS